jgi:hypothetical protein
MPAKDATTAKSLPPLRRRARRCRVAAVAVFLAGLIGGGLVYGLVPPPRDFSDDPAMAGFNRSTERQLAVLYGKQGQLIDDLNQALKQPGTQALIILGVAMAVAAGCWRCARVLEARATPPDGQGARPQNGQ